MKFLPTSGLIVVFAFCTQIGIAQTTVVLINEKPTRVKLQDGEIAAVYNEVPGYMKGYKKSPADAFQKLDIKLIEGGIDSDTPVAAEELPNDVAPEATTSFDTSSDLPEPYVNFDSGSAILTDASLTTIQSFASAMKSGNRKSILLKSWFKSGDGGSQELIQNRLDACRAYLESQGVPSNRILTSLIGSNRESKFVSVVIN